MKTLRTTFYGALLLVFTICTATAQQSDPLPYQTPVPELAQLVDAPITPFTSLSPDRATIALLERPSLPPVADLAAPELGLAGVRVNPDRTGPSRATGSTGITFRRVETGAETVVTGLPQARGIRNASWSPDGRHLAFMIDFDDRIELWVANVASGSARRMMDAAVNDAAPGSAMSWIGEGGRLLVRTVVANRGATPEEARVPFGPVVQENRGVAAPARTFQDLLTNAHDEALFDHYFTSRLMIVEVDGTARPVGPAAVYTGNSPSPDGRYLLTQERHRPYSYTIPWSRFPNRVEIWDLTTGERVHEVAALPLQDNIPIAFGSVAEGPRSFTWRNDAPSTLAWVEAQDGGDIRAQAEIRDRLFQLPAPFNGTPQTLADFEMRYAGVAWGEGDLALAYESMWQTRQRRVWRLRPDSPGADKTLVFEGSMEDRYNDPGSPMTIPGRGGESVIARDGEVIYLSGMGASAEGNRPFVRRHNLATGESVEIFRSESPYYERPVTWLGAPGERLVTQRESVTEPPNMFVRNLRTGTMTAVTDFPHPYPDLANIHKETLEYTRADGVPLTATLYLPAGYDAGRDGPLPAFVWAYPREFRSADAAGQRTDSPYQFTRVSYWGAVPMVTRGFAVLDDAAMPIVGEGDVEPNDSFVEQLVMNAEAVINEGVRRGVVDPQRVAVGGHSYGAFMTANLLAHSDLFRAGIARSGAYNRTLTPFGFQFEERTYWDAPNIYNTMSPFMNAHRVNEPILLIHGAADNNPGTFTLQSERLYGALNGLGATARLVLLPFESHGYASRESILHMLWEQDNWLQEFVRGAAPMEARRGEVSEEATSAR